MQHHSSLVKFGLISAILIAVVALSAAPTLATVPAPPPEELSEEELQLWMDGGPRDGLRLPEPLGPWNYVREYDQICDFLALWQLFDPDSSDHGGMIEAEAGYLGDVIQTDNTLEAIWCWSRYHEFSGRTPYTDNIEAAWIYCQNYPAWLEEGGGNYDNYYRSHNCAWGLTAVLKYEDATGDLAFSPYAEACAQFIVNYPLDIRNGSIWDRRLDAFVKGWCAGNLYLYGLVRGNPTYMAEAVEQGLDVLDWVNDDPDANLTWDYWAMSSGTIMWGLCNSVFLDDPALAATWLPVNAPLMDVWQEWYNVAGYDWDSSWNVAYGNAHFAVWDRIGDPRYWLNGKHITDSLLSLDTDDDGGIVAETQDPDTEDMSWVSCYLAKFLVDRMMGTPPNHDVGTLKFDGIRDGDWFPPGTFLKVELLATNFGLSDETGVEVHLEGDAGTDMVIIDLPFADQDTITFVPFWAPPAGVYTLTAYTVMPGDEEPGNDAANIRFFVNAPADVNDANPVSAVESLRILRNPFKTEATLSFESYEPTQLVLDLFDPSGRRIRRVVDNRRMTGDRQLIWDGRDARGHEVEPGVYFYRLNVGDEERSGKLTKIR